MTAGFILYTRQGCHLCDAFLHEMQQYDASLLDVVTQIDVDETVSDSQLYGDKVPILFANNTEICRYYFDAEKIKSCLKLQGDSLE